MLALLTFKRALFAFLILSNTKQIWFIEKQTNVQISLYTKGFKYLCIYLKLLNVNWRPTKYSTLDFSHFQWTLCQYFHISYSCMTSFAYEIASGLQTWVRVSFFDIFKFQFWQFADEHAPKIWGGQGVNIWIKLVKGLSYKCALLIWQLDGNMG